jgi:hypothetical protein
VQEIVIDIRGHLWMGTFGGGVSHYDGEHFRTLTTADGLVHDQVLAILEDDRGHLWFGTWGGGISRYDGLVFQTLSRRDGLAQNNVQDIHQDRRGDIWIGTEGGLTRYRPNRTVPGIELVDIVGERRYGPQDTVRIPTSQDFVIFEFTGNSLGTSPDAMAYAYHLQGYDDGWRWTRDAQVEYAALPAGNYRFEVKAVDKDLNYSEPATVDVEVFHQAVLESVTLSELQIADLFASFSKSYASQPVASAVVTNNEAQPMAVTVSLHLPDYMRRPSEERIDLQPHSSKRAELHAILDPSVFDLKEATPVRAEVAVSFAAGERTISITETRDVTVYGRGSLMWEEVSRAAAFITTADAAVAGFARSTLAAFKAEIDARGRPLRNILRATVLLEALRQHEVRYQGDANSPYARASADRAVVDHIQYPAELLQSRAGDCDDLTVLYCSLLENVGVSTALVDYPGHIFLLLDTGVSRADAYKLSLDPSLYVERGKGLWIPVEITLLDQGFEKAWRAGLEEISKLSAQDRRRLVVDTARAWEEYPPAAPAFEGVVEPPDRSEFAEAVLALK